MSSAQPDRPRLVLVTGAGRSGTSTVAGSLARLGFHVPQPEVPPDESNPRGFYEPQWVVDFHKSVLDRIPVRTIEARPRAFGLVQEELADPAYFERLRSWLAGELGLGRVVVKDPRAFWLAPLWSAVCDELGVELCFLTMLRHPADVARSRDSHYVAGRDADFRRARKVANIAAWCNVMLTTQAATSGRPRAFVRYGDLLADWRSTLARVARQLDLAYDPPLDAPGPHPVDDFIDQRLNRSRSSWDESLAPADLQSAAQGIWSALDVLVESPDDPAAVGDLARWREVYERIHEDAVGIALDHTNIEVALARRQLRARMERRHRAELNGMEPTRGRAAGGSAWGMVRDGWSRLRGSRSTPG